MLTAQNLFKRFGTEKTLIILISRVYFKTADRSEIEALLNAHTPDWDLCYRIIRQHGMRPFIYYSIQNNGIEVDEVFVKRLKADLMHLSMVNLHQQKHLMELVKGLAAAGIPVIPYKGLSFAKSYYQSSSIRESSDIDLLIDRKSVKAALRYFKAKGMPFKSGWKFPEKWLNYYQGIAKDLELKTTATNHMLACTVEIQWKLTELHMGPFVEFDFFSKGLEPKRNPGDHNEYARLQPAYDFLCVASNHFIREPLLRFKYAVDMACLMQTAGERIDGVLIRDVLSKYQHKKIVNAALSAVDDLLGISTEQLPFDPVSDNPLLGVATAYPAVKMMDMGNAHFPFFLDLQDSTLERWKARLRTLYYYMVPTEADIRFFNFPVGLLPLLFILRPFRLLFKLYSKDGH